MNGAQLSAALEASLGVGVRALKPVAGGDINLAFRARLTDGSALFVKTCHHPPASMYACEAEGLRYLAEASALRVPEIIAVSSQFLALEWIEARARGARFEEALGRGLAALHEVSAELFGFARDNFIGSLPLCNAELSRWQEFYAERRLSPLARRARAAGALDAAQHARIEALCHRLPELCGEPERPARLHGDLWSGNVMADETGAPVLIDPAVYAGDREVDLAMLQLFGAPSARFFAAYDERYPRKAGARERVALYQLYPLLVHVCLFGASYLGQLERALDACA